MADLPKLWESMKLGADRIQQIVLSLRNFSRLDSAKMKPVDIHEGIDNTLLILQNRLKAKAGHEEIQVIKEYGNLPLVECYAGQLNQVFMNIISNAIDALEELHVAGSQEESKVERLLVEGYEYLKDESWKVEISQKELKIEGGKVRGSNQFLNIEPNKLQSSTSLLPATPAIRIRTEVLNRKAVIRIADNGPGMTEEVKKRLFDPFFTTKPVGKGTGIGLSISYKIVVEQHKGTLKCYSKLGQGSEFWIELPMTPKSIDK